MVNAGGGDFGQEALPEGYRTPVQFSLQVGDYEAGSDGDAERGAQLTHLANQLGYAQTGQDVLDVLTDLTAELQTIWSVPEASKARLEQATSLVRSQWLGFGGEQQRLPSLADAAASLLQIASQVAAIGATRSAGAGDAQGQRLDAAEGMLQATIEQFVAQLETAG